MKSHVRKIIKKILKLKIKSKILCEYGPGHLEAEQNDRKVKRSKIKQKWVKNR